MIKSITQSRKIWNQKITKEDKIKIIQLYSEGLSAPKILKFFHGKIKTAKTVYDLLKKFNLDRHTSQFYIQAEHFYFSSIDSIDKAYLLGLMITDGWNNEEKGSIGIQLQEQDRYMIEWIAQQWKTKNKILTCRKKPFRGLNGNIYQSQPCSRISTCSHQMSKDLKRFGIVQRKSFVTFLPLLDACLMPHLLRGILDGDGTIYTHSNQKQICVRFLGSQFLTGGIGIYLPSILDISQQQPHLKESISYIEWSIEEEVTKILQFLYPAEGMRLRRKYEKAQNSISNTPRM